MAETSTADHAVNQARRLQILLPAEATQLAGLRQAQRAWSATAGIDQEAQELLLLAVQEAAANVVEHAYWASAEPGIIEVTFWLDADAVNATVKDRGSWRVPSTESTYRGHGLNMMRSLIDFVSIDRDPGGTAVFFRHGI